MTVSQIKIQSAGHSYWLWYYSQPIIVIVVNKTWSKFLYLCSRRQVMWINSIPRSLRTAGVGRHQVLTMDILRQCPATVVHLIPPTTDHQQRLQGTRDLVVMLSMTEFYLNQLRASDHRSTRSPATSRLLIIAIIIVVVICPPEQSL